MDDEIRIRELARRLVERSRADVGTMRAAVAREDLAPVATLAHRMAGAAGAFGFDALDAIARRLQRCAEAGDVVAVTSLLAEVDSEIARLS